ncbi:MAG: lysophospholipid acyltransferase family protein [Candidatus Sumerlaeia bacterium]|nr:lysophospholipid acyltransferase family protein [Candidatus Sumerlaeia bacterium]
MRRKRVQKAILRTVGPHLITGALRLLRLFVRMEYRNDAPWIELHRAGRPLLYAFWHCDMIPVLYTTCDYIKRGIGRYGQLVSLSEDGELLAQTVSRFNIEPVRGSSSRGARAGLKGVEQALLGGRHMGVAVDGPLGPRHKAKLGAVVIAKDIACPIIPMSFEYEAAWQFRSWDRTVVPKFFSQVTCTFHDPLSIRPDADREEIEALRDRLEQILLDHTDPKLR